MVGYYRNERVDGNLQLIKLPKPIIQSAAGAASLLRRANAIKVWANALKMPDQHKYE